MITKEQNEKRGWTPVRRRAIYCSPRCGGSCTHAAFTRCKMLAFKLTRELGKGWKSHVWENLGWWWEVVRGPVRVKQNNDGTYRAMLGEIGIDYSGEGVTPVEALQAMEEQARRDLRKLESL